MFWALVLEPSKRYSQIVENAFHISMASLDLSKDLAVPKSNQFEHVSVWVSSSKSEFLLCTLNSKSLLHQPLDLEFDVDEEIEFFVTGSGKVHLTGYTYEGPADLELDDDLEMDDDMEMNDEDAVEVEEESSDEDETVSTKTQQKKHDQVQTPKLSTGLPTPKAGKDKIVATPTAKPAHLTPGKPSADNEVKSKQKQQQGEITLKTVGPSGSVSSSEKKKRKKKKKKKYGAEKNQL